MKFGTDGVRGRANVDITPELALALGRSAAAVLTGDGPRRVVIGGDTRASTPMLAAALAAGFSASGVEVIDLGVAPTPMVADVARRANALGAVVSASHNPFHDNGIKLFARGGTKLRDEVERQIEAHLERLEDGSAAGDHDGVGAVASAHSSAAAEYLDHLHATIDRRTMTGMRVVVDAANGAAAELVAPLFAALGTETTVLAAAPDGRNINDRCGATHPALVADAVRAHGADVGIALDGDADRLIAVDHTGTVVDGDHIIAICARDLRQRGQLARDAVVVTVMSNLGFRLAMADAGIDVVETPVGDRYVLEAIAEGRYSLGGEQSGHVIFADHATTGDGLLTALMMLDAVHRAGRPLADLAGEAMTSLPQVLVNVEVVERQPDVAALLADEIAVAEKRLGARGRVLVRASGTEPLVRIMVEAPTDEVAAAAAGELAEAARRRFGRTDPSAVDR
ncbi:MAG: phosphoglucosamine mutase [Ilumatobacteraceae bacterium]|nr:phosphoglucosamine mutase [Ilumatobacteraceae bacterium]